MKPSDAPELELRRATDFERELLTRSRTWVPDWSLDEGEADFGRALLKIAARFNSEVAERLNKAGWKMALGFLDWLGLKPLAARPARMPVVLKMADTALEPVLARHPIRMQVDVEDFTVTFETETDLQVIPGQLAAVVGVDPGKDAYFVPPPGLTSLAPFEPLPTAWKLKNFVAPGSKTLQLDPGIGLVEDMLIEIAGAQYRIVSAKDDLVTIDPKVPEGEGIASDTRVAKVENFRPFGGARNLQEHVLYIGDTDVLNVEAEARIEISGLGPVPDGVTWEYWGKADPENPVDADPRWRELTVEESPPPTADAMVLKKPRGSVETYDKGLPESRWIRATLKTSSSPIATDSIQLRINPSNPVAPSMQSSNSKGQPTINIFVNATPSTPGNVYLFGQEPRLFDTFYVGCEEAFSKAGATAKIDFKLSDGAFNAVATFDAFMLGKMLAAVDQAGALHLLSIGTSGQLTQFNGREPMRPSPGGTGEGASITLTSTNVRPAMWLNGLSLCVAVIADSDVWVWSETPPFIPGVTGWISLGTVPSDQSSVPIDGVATFLDGATIYVVALRNGRLFKRTIDVSSSWQPFQTTIPTTKSLIKITSMRPKIVIGRPDVFLVLAKNATNADSTVYSVVANGTATKVFDDAATDVLPFGLWTSTGQFEVVTVRRGTPQTLAARPSGGPISDVDLDGVDISGTMIDGVAGSTSTVSYCIAKQGGDYVLIAWLPFDTELKKVLFASRLSGLSGAPSGPVAVLGDRVFLPGDSRGKILSAAIAVPTPRIAGAATFRSAIAFDLPPPALSQGDTVALTISGNLEQTSIEGAGHSDGVGDFSDKAVFWLNRRFDVATTSRPVQYFFTTGQAAGTGDVQASDTLRISGSLAPDTTHLLVRNAPAPATSYDAVEILAGPDANNDVTVSPDLSSAPGTTALDYWESSTITGQVLPSLELDASNNDFDPNAAAAGDIGFAQLDPPRQQLAAIANDPAQPTKPLRIALGARWNSIMPPALPVRFFVSPVASWSLALTTPSTNPALAWEYWNGSGWWHLPVHDGTDRLRESGVVTFKVPDDIEPVDWAGKINWWVRTRLIRGDYGEASVEVISETAGSTTKQKVKRSIANIQAPYALNISVSYALDDLINPTFLLTQDSGTQRDQSDANRTPGAQVEIFTPLSVTLGRLDAPSTQASTTPACVPDCECDTGTPSMSPAPPAPSEPGSASASASSAGRRAIYLGFTSRLFGRPVNVLFNVARESDYDSIGPLRVDTLIKDRFTPIVASDETRAIGETGVVTMSFDDPPLKEDLFGKKALSWVRLAPRLASDDWAPSIAGIYLNGVWASAAETMTRELLGSSDGRPALTVTLARPPLLQGTLELRIREPLGEEDLNALKERDPAFVKSNETDLPGNWILWRQVPDPADWGPKDRVYALDETTGAVLFGDGRNGMIPPVGTDSIVAFTYRRTEPAADGKLAANLVKPRTELNLVSPIETVESVAAADQSAGGVGPEPRERVMQFAPSTLRHRGRAVSLKDFEDLVREKSDYVMQARAFRRGRGIRLVVVARGANSSPSRAQQRELRRMLLEIAPAALGVRNALTIAGPRLRKLRIALGLRVPNLDVGGAVATDAQARLVKRFGLDGGWSLGRTPREDDVAESLLDIDNLDGIASIRLFEVDDVGGDRPWQGTVARDELAVLGPEDVRVEFQILEAAA